MSSVNSTYELAPSNVRQSSSKAEDSTWPLSSLKNSLKNSSWISRAFATRTDSGSAFCPNWFESEAADARAVDRRSYRCWCRRNSM